MSSLKDTPWCICGGTTFLKFAPCGIAAAAFLGPVPGPDGEQDQDVGIQVGIQVSPAEGNQARHEQQPVARLLVGVSTGTQR